MIPNKLTGRKRHRVHKPWFGKPVLILQVEVEGFVPEYTLVSIEGEFRKWWEDARPEQLLITPLTIPED